MNEPIKFENGNAVLDAEISAKIAFFEERIKDIKAKEDALKKAILEAMVRNNIVKVETDAMTISYVEATLRETFDSKKLKKDNPDLYDEYVRMTPVKATVRIKVKA